MHCVWFGILVRRRLRYHCMLVFSWVLKRGDEFYRVRGIAGNLRERVV